MSTGRESPILQLWVRGPGVRSGRIAVPDLVKICQELQNAVTRQAEALEGRKTIHPGPSADLIQHGCTLELLAVKRDSTRLEFGIAKTQLPLAPDMDFGVEVVKELTGAIKSVGNEKKSVDPGVLQALYRLGSLVRTERISSIEITASMPGHTAAQKAVINRTVVERIAARLSSSRRKSTAHIDGVLDMVDFKAKDLRCRIDPPVGASIMCTFDPDQADVIYSLLRKPVRIGGEATMQPHTDRIESVHIQQIEPIPALFWGELNFFSDQTIEQLAKAQNVRPIKDLSVLWGGFPTDEDVDDFVEEIYNARK